jgi:hypothetical protein
MGSTVFSHSVNAAGAGEQVFLYRSDRTQPVEVVVSVTSGGPATFALSTVAKTDAGAPLNGPSWMGQSGLGSVSSGSSATATVVGQQEGYRVTWTAGWVGTITGFA